MGEFCLAWRIIRRYRIDLVHSHWFIPSGLVGAAITKIWKKPHVITSHVLDANLFGKFRVFLPLLSIIVASADLITTNSSYTKQQIETLVPLNCPCRVIPMGIYPPSILPSPNRSRDQTILYVGRLIEWKGIDTLIRSMILVKREVPDSRLIITGEGPYRDFLQHLVQDTGLTEVVRFFGRASDDDLIKLYDSAAVFVLPSKRHQGLVMEGLGVVLIEAMSHGIPVIGSNIGGIPDIITDGETGLLVPEQDPAALAGCIVKLLSDKTLQATLRTNGFVRVKERFSWEIISQRFSDVYREVNSPPSGNGQS
jgi:glycosyltransferase involved in cell wall biosynthesis